MALLCFLICTFIISKSLGDQPPSIVIESTSTQKDFLHPRYFPQKSHVKFKCNATNAATYTWFRDNTPVENDTRTRLLDGELTILQLDYKLDDGVYQCVARNKFGTAVSDYFEFKVKVFGNFLHPHTEKDDKVVIEAELGKPLQLACPQTSYIYPKGMHWIHQEVSFMGYHDQVKESGNVKVTQDGTLVISHLGEDDVTALNEKGGICCAIYASGSIRTSNIFVIKAIKERRTSEQVEPIIYGVKSEIKSVQIGDIVEFPCIAIGNPTPTVAWYHNGSKLAATRDDLKTKKQNGFLVLTVTNPSSSGIYTCEADGNKDVRVILKTVKVVLDDPSWVLKPEYQYVEAGNDVYLACLARGKAKPSYTWYYRGNKVENANGNGTSPTDGFLFLRNVIGTFEYTCFASNARGTVSSTATVSNQKLTTTVAPSTTDGHVHNSDNTIKEADIDSGCLKLTSAFALLLLVQITIKVLAL